MDILVTGANGYIGTVLVPMLRGSGHRVVGLDSDLFSACALTPVAVDPDAVTMDVRDLREDDLQGFDAVVHLAAVSNDPIGDLNPDTTYEINHRGSVHVGELAKAAGVSRFVFASSCSLYGAAGTDVLDETASFNPVTPYGESKVFAERDLSAMADDSFTPTYLRNGTAYGASPRLRGDVVLNSLVGYACTTGEVRMQSDGTPWRPIVHVRDISGAVEAVLDAPRDAVHDQAFNVGHSDGNYQIRDLAEIVSETVAGSTVTLAESAAPDPRSYRVTFDKMRELVPGFDPQWTAQAGAVELRDAVQAAELTIESFTSSRFIRLKRVRELIDAGEIDSRLRRSTTGDRVSPAEILERMPAGSETAPAPVDA